MANTSVLYVEDEPDDVFFMQRAFKAAAIGHSLITVGDGQQAISYLSGSGCFGDRTTYPLPSLVLLDLNLPERSGFEVLEWMRQQSELNDVTVVIFSSSGRPEDLQKAQTLGASGYFIKPPSGLDFTDIARQLHERWLTVSDEHVSKNGL
jgi:CheY-like chemotaxis protein